MVGKHVLIGDITNTLNAINLDTGKLDWEFGFSDVNGSTSAPVCADPVCYVIDAVGLLVAVDVRAASLVTTDADPLGPLLWDTSLRTDNDADSFQRRPLMVKGNYIYATTNYVDGNANATIQILDRESGVLVHTIALGEIALGVPVVKDNLLLVATLTSIRAYSIDSYELMWQTDFDGSNDLWATNDMALAGNIIVDHLTRS